MASEREILSTEIVNRGIEDSGPYAGSLSFSVRVRRGLPDFLNSVKLKRETWLWLWLSHKPWHLFCDYTNSYCDFQCSNWETNLTRFVLD